MLDNIPIQKRLAGILVLIGIVFVFEMLYFSQTLALADDVGNLEQKTAFLTTGEDPEVDYKVRLLELDAQIRQLQSRKKGIATHVEFIEYIQNLGDQNEVKVVSMPTENIRIVDAYAVAGIDFKLQGAYTDILRLLYSLEFQDRAASVERLSMNVEQVRLRNRKEKLLIAEVRVNRLLEIKKE